MSAKQEAQQKSFPIQVVTYSILECTRRVRALAGADGETAGEDVVYDVILSTEHPVEKSWCIETLSHKKSAVDMSYARSGLSLLLEHGVRNLDQMAAGIIDPLLHVGVIEEVATVDDTKLKGALRFSKSALAQEIERDVNDRTRRFISVGYIKRKWKLVKPAGPNGEKEEYLVTRWTPVEGSIVSIPADPNAKVGRSAGGSVEYPVELESDNPAAEEPKMEPNKEAPPAGATATSPEVPAPGGVDTRSLNGGGAPPDRNKEIAELVRLCESNGVAHRAAEFIERGVSLKDAGLEILRERRSVPTNGTAAEILDGLKAKDRKRYSVSRALDMLCRRVANGTTFDGVEGEVHQHLEKRQRDSGIQTQGGIILPVSMGGDIERRTMTTNQAAKGAELVFDQPGELIEFLRNASVLFRMGGRLLSGLSGGNIPFPKQTGTVTVTWPGENPASPVSPTDVATGTVTLAPKTMAGGCQISRQLLRQSSFDSEQMIRQDLAEGHGAAFERGAFHGKGAGGELTGIYVAPDVGAVGMANVVPTWVKCTDMIAALGNANALKGKLGFITTPGIASRLAATLMASAAGAAFIWSGRVEDGQIGGYPAMASNNVLGNLGAGADEHGFMFGNWQEVVAGMWGDIEITVDPYTAAGSGLVKFFSWQLGDVVLRHGQSFCKATAAKVA